MRSHRCANASEGFDMGPHAALPELDDNAVIDLARSTLTELHRTPQGSRRDDLLLLMGALWRELNRRGISDVVVEGGRSDVSKLFRDSEP
jgi:hypothetical protein